MKGTIPNYTKSEVLNYFKISDFVLKKKIIPLVRSPLFSFYALVEIQILKEFSVNPLIPIETIKATLNKLELKYEGKNPLIRQQFRSDIDLVLNDLILHICSCQLWFLKQNLISALNQIHYNNNCADKIYLQSGNITISPAVNFGKPFLTNNGTPTKIITDLYKAGDTIETLAYEYNCTNTQIKEALRFQLNENIDNNQSNL